MFCADWMIRRALDPLIQANKLRVESMNAEKIGPDLDNAGNTKRIVIDATQPSFTRKAQVE